MWKLVLTVLILIVPATVIRGQTQFRISYDATIPTSLRATVQAATERAAAAWTRVLRDDVTVSLTIFWEFNETSIRKASGSTRYARRPYADLMAAMKLDASSADDVLAVNNLPSGSIPVYLNYTSDNPNGPGSAVPYLDNNGDGNNTIVRVPLALEKALGMRNPTAEGEDGNILFNGALDWDYDTRDGRIADDVFDFEVTALHELGHILGFTSRIDSRLNLCAQRGQAAVAYDFITPMDLFTYSEDSAFFGAVDWSIDKRARYFSLDAGITSIQPFATGLQLAGCDGGGSGYTRGHWQNRNFGETAIGIMDPATIPFQTITANDLQVMDVIGWDTGIPLTELVGFNVADGRSQVQWRQVADSPNYSILASSNLKHAFSSVARVSGNAWSGDLPALPNTRLLLVQANPPAKRAANAFKAVKPIHFNPEAHCDSEACACHHHAVDSPNPAK